MKSILFTLLAVCLSFSMNAQSASTGTNVQAVATPQTSPTGQTAESIIAKHIEAIGGKEKISQIKSLYIESAMEIMGNEAPTKTYQVNGKAFKMELEIMGSTIMKCVTEKGGWDVNPMAGGDVVDMPAEQHKAALDNLTIGGVFLNYAEKGTKAELKGKKTINKKEYFELAVTPKEGKAMTYLIDPETYYIFSSEAKGEMMGQEITVVTTFSDYRKTDSGYVVPFTTEADMGQMQMTSKVKTVEVNKAIDESVFAKPK